MASPCKEFPEGWKAVRAKATPDFGRSQFWNQMQTILQIKPDPDASPVISSLTNNVSHSQRECRIPFEYKAASMQGMSHNSKQPHGSTFEQNCALISNGDFDSLATPTIPEFIRTSSAEEKHSMVVCKQEKVLEENCMSSCSSDHVHIPDSQMRESHENAIIEETGLMVMSKQKKVWDENSSYSSISNSQTSLSGQTPQFQDTGQVQIPKQETLTDESNTCRYNCGSPQLTNDDILGSSSLVTTEERRLLTFRQTKADIVTPSATHMDWTVSQTIPFKGATFSANECILPDLPNDVPDIHSQITVDHQWMPELLQCCQTLSHTVEEVSSLLMSKKLSHQPSTPGNKLRLDQHQSLRLQLLALLHRRHLNGILADEATERKTFLVIAFLSYLWHLKKEGPHLILTSASSLEKWLTDIKAWCPTLNILCYDGQQEVRRGLHSHLPDRDFLKFDIIIATHDVVSGAHGIDLQKPNFHCVVYDEAYALTNLLSGEYQHLIDIQAKWRLILQEGPLPDTFLELMSLLVVVMPDVCSDKISSLKHFFAQKCKVEDMAVEVERAQCVKKILKPFLMQEEKSQISRLHVTVSADVNLTSHTSSFPANKAALSETAIVSQLTTSTSYGSNLFKPVGQLVAHPLPKPEPDIPEGSMPVELHSSSLPNAECTSKECSVSLMDLSASDGVSCSTSSSEAKFICSYCGLHFQQMGNLLNHLKRYHEQNIRTDENSLNTVCQAKDMQSHPSRNIVQQCYVCAVCGTSFKYERHLKTHSLRHLRFPSLLKSAAVEEARWKETSVNNYSRCRSKANSAGQAVLTETMELCAKRSLRFLDTEPCLDMYQTAEQNLLDVTRKKTQEANYSMAVPLENCSVKKEGSEDCQWAPNDLEDPRVESSSHGCLLTNEPTTGTDTPGQLLLDLLQPCMDLSSTIKDIIGGLLKNDRRITWKPSPHLNIKICTTPYETLGFKWLVLLDHHEINGILSDKIRMGNIVQTLILFKYLRRVGDAGPHLIVAHPSALETWLAQIEVWCLGMDVLCYHGTQEARNMMQSRILDGVEHDFDIVVTTHDLATGEDRTVFQRVEFHYVVFDEADSLKNLLSQQYSCLMEIQTRHHLILRQGDLPDTLLELISLLLFVMPRVCWSKIKSLRRIFIQDYKKQTIESEEMVELAKQILLPFILRHSEVEVQHDWKPKTAFDEKLVRLNLADVYPTRRPLEPGTQGAGENASISANYQKEGEESSKSMQEVDVEAESSKSTQEMDMEAGSSKSTQEMDVEAGSSKSMQEVDMEAGSSKSMQEVDVEAESSKSMQEEDVEAGSSKSMQEEDVEAGSSKSMQEGDVEAGSSKSMQEGDVEAESSKSMQEMDVEEESPICYYTDLTVYRRLPYKPFEERMRRFMHPPQNRLDVPLPSYMDQNMAEEGKRQEGEDDSVGEVLHGYEVTETELDPNVTVRQQLTCKVLKNDSVKLVSDLLQNCKKVSDTTQNILSSFPTEKNTLSWNPSPLSPRLFPSPRRMLGVKWLELLHHHWLNGIVCEETELENSLQAIAFLLYLQKLQKEGPHLIIVPSSALDALLMQIELWCSDLTVLCYHGPQEARSLVREQILNADKQDYDILITTCDIAAGEDRSVFQRLEFHCAVFAEADMLMNLISQEYQNLMEIQARHRMILRQGSLPDTFWELMSFLAYVMPDICRSKIGLLKDIFTQAQSQHYLEFKLDQMTDHIKEILLPFVLPHLESLANQSGSTEEDSSPSMLPTLHFEASTNNERQSNLGKATSSKVVTALRQFRIKKEVTFEKSVESKGEPPTPASTLPSLNRTVASTATSHFDYWDSKAIKALISVCKQYKNRLQRPEDEPHRARNCCRIPSRAGSVWMLISRHMRNLGCNFTWKQCYYKWRYLNLTYRRSTFHNQKGKQCNIIGPCISLLNDEFCDEDFAESFATSISETSGSASPDEVQLPSNAVPSQSKPVTGPERASRELVPSAVAPQHGSRVRCFRWDTDSTEALILVYSEIHKKFDGLLEKQQFLSLICWRMRKLGYKLSRRQISNKWSSLRQEYKRSPYYSEKETSCDEGPSNKLQLSGVPCQVDIASSSVADGSSDFGAVLSLSDDSLAQQEPNRSPATTPEDIPVDHSTQLATKWNPASESRNACLTCAVCEKEFSTIQLFKTHLKIHMSQKPYFCQFCPHRFGSNHHLQVHQRLHSRRRFFVCQQCCRPYPISCHMEIKLPDRTFKYSICMKCKWKLIFYS